MDENKKEVVVQKEQRRVLVTRTNRNAVVLIIAVFLVAALSGLLGAFKNGEFQKTYDYVVVNKEVSELNYEDPVFEDMSKDSREVFSVEDKIIYDEITNESSIVTVDWYGGYYKNYFFASYWFYLETLFNTVLVLIFYIALVNFLVSRRQDKDELYNTLSEEINGMVVDNELPAVTFEPFLEVWNNNRKVKQHIANVKYKISKLVKRTKYKIRKVFYHKNENGDLVFIYPEGIDQKYKFFQLRKRYLQFRQLKFYRKKVGYEELLTKSYIETNVIYEKVKHFNKIDPSFIYSGNNGLHKTTDEYSSIKGDKKAFSKDLRKKVIIGFSITMMVTSILAFTMFRAEDNWIVIVYMVFLRMLPLVVQTIMGIDYTNVYMEKQLIPTLKYRISIASIFIANEGKVGLFENIPFLEIKKLEVDKVKDTKVEEKEEEKIEPTPRLEFVVKNLQLKEVN